MSLACISYNKQWIGLPGDFLELLCTYIAETFEQEGMSGKPEWYLQLHEDAEVTAKGYRRGYNILSVADEDFPHPEDKATFARLLRTTIDRINAKGPLLSQDELNRLEQRKGEKDRRPWRYSLKSSGFVEALNILCEMLEGTRTKAGLTINFEWVEP